jgi:hypothetical protein
MMETFAVYWEPVIKTYGIDRKTGLSLVSLEIDPEDTGSLGDRFLEMAGFSPIPGAGSVLLFFARPLETGRLAIHLVADRKSAAWSLPSGDPHGAGPLRHGIRVVEPVELICFQGPHYGDRYGIAAAALNAVANHGLSLLATVCTGASIYLVAPEGTGPDIRLALSDAFVVP